MEEIIFPVLTFYIVISLHINYIQDSTTVSDIKYLAIWQQDRCIDLQ